MPSKRVQLIATTVILIVGWIVVHNISTPRITQVEDAVVFTTEITDIQHEECNEQYALTETDYCTTLSFIDPTDNKGNTLTLVDRSVGLNTEVFYKGQKIRVSSLTTEDIGYVYSFAGFERVESYYVATSIFILIIVAIAGIKGIKSIISMGISIFVVFSVIIPMVLKGQDPILVTTIIGFVMYSILIVVTNGVNKLSYISILGSTVSIVSAVIASYAFSHTSSITGFGDEIAGMLHTSSEYPLNISRIIMASFILGVFGVADDATVSQVYTIAEILKNNPKITKSDLFKSGMEVGSGHIGSLINTLFIAYVASSLPLLLVLFGQNLSIMDLLNGDLFAEEIIRTLVGSIGLIIAVPSTTFFAVKYLSYKDVKEVEHTSHC